MKAGDGWQFASLGEIAHIYSGGTPSRSVPSYWGGGVPWVSTAEMDHLTITSTKETISELGLANSAAKIAPAGTLLMAMYGQGKTRGKASILGIDAAMNQACAAIQPNARVDPEFLLAYLCYSYEMIRSFSNAGGQENLSGAIVKKIPIALPDLAEQSRIAQMLQDASRLVGVLERLIAKKHAIKQGMMQHLMTSRTRLSGSVEPSSVVTLGSVTSWLSGGTPNRATLSYWNGNIPWISATSLKQTHVRDSEQRLTEEGLRAGSRLAPKGSILVLVRGMALHREVRIGLAEQAVSFNQDIKALIPRSGLLPDYLVYVLQSHFRQILDLVSSAGSGTGVLDTSLLKRLPIWIPGESEQRAITNKIADADAEILLLRDKLAKSQAIKLGMMQQLLTGKIGLPVTEDVKA